MPHKRSGKDTADMASPPSKKSKNLPSGTSSLSPTSLSSPPPAGTTDQLSVAASPGSSSSDSHQPEPALAVPQYQVFGPDPLSCEDPTIYHVRDVTPEMTEEEKKDIFSVSYFPKTDLTEIMAGNPPDKDFSNAKPTNQVSANTFATYIEPYVRPLMEEDINFLKEKVSDIRDMDGTVQTINKDELGRPGDSIFATSSREETLHRNLGGRRWINKR